MPTIAELVDQARLRSQLATAIDTSAVERRVERLLAEAERSPTQLVLEALKLDSAARRLVREFTR